MKEEKEIIKHNDETYHRTGSGGHGTPDGPLNYIIYGKSKNIKHSEFIYICEDSNVLLRQYNMRVGTEVHVEGIELLYYEL